MIDVKNEYTETVEIFIQQLLNGEFTDAREELRRRFDYVLDRCDSYDPMMTLLLFRQCVGVSLKELSWYNQRQLANNPKLTPAMFEGMLHNVSNLTHVLMVAIDTVHLSMIHYKTDLYNLLQCVTIFIAHRRMLAEKYFLED